MLGAHLGAAPPWCTWVPKCNVLLLRCGSVVSVFLCVGRPPGRGAAMVYLGAKVWCVAFKLWVCSLCVSMFWEHPSLELSSQEQDPRRPCVHPSLECNESKSRGARGCTLHDLLKKRLSVGRPFVEFDARPYLSPTPWLFLTNQCPLRGNFHQANARSFDFPTQQCSLLGNSHQANVRSWVYPQESHRDLSPQCPLS